MTWTVTQKLGAAQSMVQGVKNAHISSTDGPGSFSKKKYGQGCDSQKFGSGEFYGCFGVFFCALSYVLRL